MTPLLQIRTAVREAKLKTTQLRFREATIVPNLIAPRRSFVLVKNRRRRSRPRIFPSILVWHSTGPLIKSRYVETRMGAFAVI